MKRIKPPKFRVGRFVLNEYEVRQLLYDVAQGNVPAGIVIKDEKGQTAFVDAEGKTSSPLYGMDMIDRIAMDHYRLLKRKRNQPF